MPEQLICEICHRDSATVPELPVYIPNHRHISIAHITCVAESNAYIRNWQLHLKEFHHKFGLNLSTIPELQDLKEAALRTSLILEEANEIKEAIENNDLVEIADGLADLVYVALGTAVSYGIDLQPIWEEVHKTNMAKEGGATRHDGKILKPKDWIPPDLTQLLIQQGWNPNG